MHLAESLTQAARGCCSYHTDQRVLDLTAQRGAGEYRRQSSAWH